MTSSLLKNHPYKYLFYSGIVNGVGDRFSQVAVLTLLLQLTGSGLAVGAAMGIRILPYLFLSPIGGRLSDRVSKKKLMITTDIVRVPFALSLLFVNTENDLWIIFVCVLALSCGEAFYQPVRKSAIAGITDAEELIRVNGLEQVMIGVVLIIGSITGGIVTYVIGVKMAFLWNALTFIFAVLLIKHLTLPMNIFANEEGGETPLSAKVFFNKLHKVVLAVCLIELVISATDGIFNVLISYYGSETLQLGGLGIGALYGSLGIGLAGSFVITRKLSRSFLQIGLFSIILEGVLQVAASQADALLEVSLLFTGISFVGGIGAACFHTLIMKHTAKHWQGRVFGGLEASTNVILGGFMLASGIALDHFSERFIGGIGGGVNIVFGSIMVVVFFLFKNRAKQTPF
ncbi:MFS transporter [Halobacillus rhizosphaerae]|uniref:MFS transporter n=1 Tax=Halobacillus rhizosphaerae TaxID=3064889 RepID=UPI00398AC291